MTAEDKSKSERKQQERISWQQILTSGSAEVLYSLQIEHNLIVIIAMLIRRSLIDANSLPPIKGNSLPLGFNITNRENGAFQMSSSNNYYATLQIELTIILPTMIVNKEGMYIF